MRPALRAHLLLLLAAALWGFAFVAQRAGMQHLEPFTFNGIRFALGAVVLLPLLAYRRHHTLANPPPVGPSSANRRRRLLVGLLLGTILFLAASLQQIGIVDSSAGKAGFITGLYVVLVPLLGRLVGQRIRVAEGLGALVAAVGLYLLSVRQGLRLAPGDGLILAGALFWALHVLAVGRWSRRLPVVELAFTQFAVCALLSGLTAVAFEPIRAASIAAAWLPLAYGGIVSVGVAYTLQVVAQRDAAPTVAAVLLGLEAVFAAIGGRLLLGETLTLRGLVGCGLMLGAVWVAGRQRAVAGESSRAGRSPVGDRIDSE